jgi:hypothetical protein
MAENDFSRGWSSNRPLPISRKAWTEVSAAKLQVGPISQEWPW